MKIYNIFQADFLIKNKCEVIGSGMAGKIYIEFTVNETFNKYMSIWKNRKH